jgi:hypothetical protein
MRASNGDGNSGTAAGAAAAHLHPDESGHISSGDGGSDDDLDGDVDDADDSTGSPGGHSDFGDHGHAHHHRD